MLIIKKNELMEDFVFLEITMWNTIHDLFDSHTEDLEILFAFISKSCL